MRARASVRASVQRRQRPATREAHDLRRGAMIRSIVVRSFSRCWAAAFPTRSRGRHPPRRAVTSNGSRCCGAARGAADSVSRICRPRRRRWLAKLALIIDERAAAEAQNRAARPHLHDAHWHRCRYYTPGVPRLARRSRARGAERRLSRTAFALLQSLWLSRRAGQDRTSSAISRGEPFADAYDRLRHLASDQAAQARARLLDALEAAGATSDLSTGSPCLFCSARSVPTGLVTT